MQDPLEVRLDRIQAFLTANGAGTFAKLMYNIPVLYRAVLDNRLTMIIAPSDKRLEKLSNEIKKPLAELFATEAGRSLLANHISTTPTKKTFPMFTAINGVTYGSGPADIIALDVSASTVIDGVVILIVPHLIGNPQQEVKIQKSSDPGVFAGMTRNAFKALIDNGSLRGKDLIALCNTNTYVNENFCDWRDPAGRTLFHQLVAEEFGFVLETNHNARDEYIHLHQEKDAKSYPTYGVLLDGGPKIVPTATTCRYEMTMFKLGVGEIRRIVDFNSGDIMAALWSHPIDLYLLAVLYKPTQGSSSTKLLLRKLTKDPQGIHRADDGTVLGYNTHSKYYTADITNENIRAREVPIFEKVIHYTHAFPETLPFLYTTKIVEYNIEDLFDLLSCIHAGDYWSVKNKFLESDPRTILDVLPFNSAGTDDVHMAIKISMGDLVRLIQNNQLPEPEEAISLAGVDLSIALRFLGSYRLIGRKYQLLILMLLLLFSNAVIVREAN